MAMNQSILDVCQDALYLLRQDITVPTLDQEATCTDIEWRKCKKAFGIARLDILATHDWHFARAIVTLGTGSASSGAECAYGSNKFTKPSTVTVGGSSYPILRIVDVFSGDKRIGWQIVGGTLYTAERATSALAVFDNDDISSWSPFARSALADAIARECAIPIAGRIEDMKVFDSLYKEKLTRARIADLTEGNVGNRPFREAMAMVQQVIPQSNQDIAMSIDGMCKRFDTIVDLSRRTVLSRHDWAFSTRTDDASSMTVGGWREGSYRFMTSMPNCLRLVAVFDPSGRLNEWIVQDGMIIASRPISNITYTVDVKDFDKFSVFAYRALLYRIAADIAAGLASNADAVRQFEAQYENAMREAIMKDSSSTNTPTDAWGENHYVRQMRGGFRPAVIDAVLFRR